MQNYDDLTLRRSLMIRQLEGDGVTFSYERHYSSVLSVPTSGCKAVLWYF